MDTILRRICQNISVYQTLKVMPQKEVRANRRYVEAREVSGLGRWYYNTGRVAGWFPLRHGQAWAGHDAEETGNHSRRSDRLHPRSLVTNRLLHLRRQLRQVMRRVAEQPLDHHTTAEVVPDGILLGHAD